METLKTEWAVDSIVGLLRLILRGDLLQPEANGSVVELPATSMDLAVRVVRECPDVPADVCSAFAEKWLTIQPPAGQNGTFKTNFEELCALLLPRDIYPEEVRYFAMRGIRARSLITLSNFTVAAAHLLTQILSDAIQTLKTHPRLYSEFRGEIMERLESDLVEKLRVGLVAKCKASQPPMESLPQIIANRIFNAFIDMGIVLGFVTASSTGLLSFGQESTNAEYLMNRLFGIPTRIPGFDLLFGGGGLMLTDSPRFGEDPNPLAPSRAKMIGGRSVLCIGRAGSGKTLLSLAFAVEVARKGGIVWIISFEQTDEECLYGLESIGISTRHPAFRVELGENVFDEALLALTDRAPTQGALVFLRPTDNPGEYPKFLGTLEKHLQSMSKYPLRLIIVDPVSVFSQSEENAEDLRARARRMCESAKRANVNIWFTTDQLSENRFEENIADTVIDMGSESLLGQPWGYIQIPKSRFQVAAKGRQALEIHSSHGIRIYPSSALVAELVSSKQGVTSDDRLEFGVRGTERLLGAEPIRPGDLVAIAGPGKGKALLGAHFLLAQAGTQELKGRRLYVSDYSKDRMKRFLRSVAGEEAWPKFEDEVDILSLVTGYVDPGRILLEIEQALDRSQKRSPGPMRVLLTNLARWEEDIPYIRNDLSFGIALIKLLRSYNAATLIVCGDSVEGGKRLQDSIIDYSDFFLQCNRLEFQGRTTTLVSTVKSRILQHARESYELRVERSGVTLSPAPLLRIGESGRVTPIKISLFLHAETENHREFNSRILEGLRASISPQAEIEEQGRRFDPNLLSMSQYSAIDELQVFQIDEFQLPTRPSALLPQDALYSFDVNLNRDLLRDRVQELAARVYSKDPKRLLAVPFYMNLSVLAIYEDKLHRIAGKSRIHEFPNSWRDLADLCGRFDQTSEGQDDILFSCPVYDRGFETYNCFFFEILSTLCAPTENDFRELSHWIERPEATEAAWIFWRLCKKAYGASVARKSIRDKKNGSGGIISRHWYNTLNQALSDPAGNRQKVSVRPLFGDVTIAGEWYLAIPSHSASPEVGLRLIEYLTAPDNETKRVDLGVGLPTRKMYYTSTDSDQVSISRYYHFPPSEVYRLYKKAIQRSKFHIYQRFAETITTQLISLLSMPEPKGSPVAKMRAVKGAIRKRMQQLSSTLHFLSEGSALE